MLHGKEEAYYKGKMVGDIVRLLGVTYAGAVAITEMILGGAATIGGGGLCLTGAGTIAGVPAIAGGVVLVAAGVVTVGSTLAIGADALADFQKDWDAYQDSKHVIGENGTQTNSTTTWKNGKTERIDVENPAPGERAGQIHYHDASNNKWLYDIDKNQLVNQKSGELAPKSIQNLLNDSEFVRGLEKALKVLGE